MKRVFFLVVALCFLFGVSAFSETVADLQWDKAITYSGWSVFGSDDDIDTAAEIITELDITYAQMTSADTLEILSSDSADTGHSGSGLARTSIRSSAFTSSLTVVIT